MEHWRFQTPDSLICTTPGTRSPPICFIKFWKWCNRKEVEAQKRRKKKTFFLYRSGIFISLLFQTFKRQYVIIDYPTRLYLLRLALYFTSPQILHCSEALELLKSETSINIRQRQRTFLIEWQYIRLYIYIYYILLYKVKSC